MSSRQRRWAFRLRHIIEAVERIQGYVSGMSYGQFQADQKTADAVLRNLEVIGEAARHIPPEVEQAYPQVPWVDMRAMRNVLAHQYEGVNLPTIWKTVQEDLPPLTPLLLAILQQESRD